ncbi:MAG: hypothetical protein K8T89_03035, partial [Planctomycetes bacterium]|nr:hypothetical protein [Planctomycetota bacterium]
MYREPYNKAFRYLCGLYQQDHAQCKHNTVDGPLATHFLLGCVRQRLFDSDLRAALRSRIRLLAEQERRQDNLDLAIASRRSFLQGVRLRRERVGRNLALAEGPEQYQAIVSVFNELKIEENKVENEIRDLERQSKPSDLDEEVERALARLDHMADQSSQTKDFGEIGLLFKEINAR